MENVFIKLSELRKSVNKNALSNNHSNSSKIVKQIIGVNPLNREWVDDASNKLKVALQSQGFTRVKNLVKSLEALYFCDYILKQNQYTDAETSQLIHKAETSYINSCLSFIEQNIHASNKILNSFSHLFSAVEVITETNPTMGAKYRQMLSRYHSLYTSFTKIKEICSSSNRHFNKQNAQQIKSLMIHHEASFKMYPSLKEELVELIKTKLDESLFEIQESIEKSLSDRESSLEKLLLLLNGFYDVYNPLSDICEQKRFKEILNKRESYLKLNNILESEYKEWLKTFEYYSLPRNKIDEAKISAVINSINKYAKDLNSNFVEFKDLNPSPETIQNHLKSIISQQGKDSIINYYKIENDLLNATDSDKKIEEIIRFIKHLNEKLAERGIDSQLKEELSRMKSEFMSLLDSSVEKKIKQYVSTNPSQNNLKHFFDKILEYFYDLNDLAKISYWQNIKKTIFTGLTELQSMMESLQSDFELFNKLPDSPTKKTVKEKLIKSTKKLNETIPLLALYQIGDVHEYLNTIALIEKGISDRSSAQQTCDRLILLDKFTTKNIVIFSKELLKIGRDADVSDIILKSDWVSGAHCSINFKSKQLIDNGSTNGTFVNKERGVGERLRQDIDLDSIKLFNVAEAFDIHIEKYESFYVFRVAKVFDSELTSNDREYVKSLFNTDFVWLKKYSSLSIDTFTGKIKETDDSNMNELVIMNDEHFSIIDKENSKNVVSINESEEINTDRFSITLS